MLILPIKSKWFNMILSGDKQEEYREIKPYYTTRFKKIFEMYPNSNIPTGLDKQLIGFRNGYGSSRPQFTAVCSLDIKTGKEEWGAEPGTEYYTLHIHEIRERKSYIYQCNGKTAYGLGKSAAGKGIKRNPYRV